LCVADVAADGYDLLMKFRCERVVSEAEASDIMVDKRIYHSPTDATAGTCH
jgi:hypothetical protein